MLKEIQKRPFARPLFWWITGILLQVCFPLQQSSVWFMLSVATIVLFAMMIAKGGASLSYDARWVWGAIIACVLLFLAIQSTAYTEQRLLNPSAPGWLQEKAKIAQIYLVERLDRLNLTDSGKAILATLTLNHRQEMSWEIRNQFSTVGVAHLLSVSGFHVAVVCNFLSILFSVFPKQMFFRWSRYLLMISLLWTFAYVAGLSIPTVRAALMLSIYLTGQILGRRQDRYNTLAAAAFCMLLYNPFYLFEVGFQLSFIAVFFILYLQPRFSRLIEVRNPLLATPWNILTVTVAAQIGTVFLCGYYFRSCSTVFLFTNIFLSLLATVLIPATLLWMFLPAWIPGYGILQWLVETLTNHLMWFVARFSQVPGAALSLHFDFVTMLSAYGILGLWLCYCRSKRTWMLFSALSLTLFVLCWQIGMR
ncbi:MAG: ComEC/Rec2 family competence protein [Tannerella sp.]|jgi:competence protein ComEC|nr:ComEC/Rec2 family competence protein [Tannerella sp.]